MKTFSFKYWLLYLLLLDIFLLVGCGGQLTTGASPEKPAKEGTQKENHDNQVSHPTTVSSVKNNTSIPDSSVSPTTQTSPSNSSTTGAYIQQPNSIVFWNIQQGLLLSASNGHGLVWKTVDGGHSWTKVYEDSNLLSRVVLTGSTSAKVLVGDDWKNPKSQIETTNNGQTWVKMPYQKPLFADQACSIGKFGEDLFVNHSAPSSSQIWALCDGQPAAGQMSKLIVFSHDGGKNWTKKAEVTPKAANTNGLGLNGYPMGIDFLSDGRGWLWESRGNSFYTIDGGQNWIPFTNLTSPETKEARSMSLIDNQHGYALLWVNNKYLLMFTKDGGKSWSEANAWINQ
ncbi:hypothetical protein LSG31_05660 [Fodinisporobacter ferrooxydans]|uniref:Photosynthesis system II assembly factor Ycf48/Hcf136-like domain-containing protein n=1 Tax=Fodinisporobacter ferrooxydans TaxID=2901836 RepID=A0ABY4CML8_9BACL|nr:hypothetical protein LSG31_05660 [Alicyclobacillaceae bacterium MYW30-H2]